MATARPASDISAGTWLSTGASLHGVLSETTANDADYIYTSTPGVAVVGLDEVTDPGVYTGFSLPYRAASNDGTKALRVALREGTTLIAEETRYNVPATETDYALTPSASAMEAVTNWSDLRLEFEYTVSVGVAPTIALGGAANAWPIDIDATYYVEHQVGDEVQVQAASDYGFTTILADDTFTLAGTGSGAALNAILSSITSPTVSYIRIRVAGGAWSNIVQHGTLAVPAVTSSTTMTVYGGFLLSETVTLASAGYLTLGGDDQIMFEVIGAQPGTSFNLRWLDDAAHDYATPMDFDTNNIYELTLNVTGLNGATDSTAATVEVLDSAPDQFTFTDVTDAAFSTTYAGTTGVLAGMASGAPITLTGDWDDFRIHNGTAWGSYLTNTTGVTVSSGYNVEVRITSGAAYSVAKSATLTIQGVSDTFSVTTLADPATVEAVHRRTEILDLGYGTGPATPSAITIADGDKVVLQIHCKFNGSPQTVTAVTANSGAITFTSMGTPTAAANERVYTFYADTSGVTSLSLSIAVGGSTHQLGLHVFSVRGAGAGAATATHHEVRSVTNEDPHDVDGSLSVPTSGVALLSVGGFGGGNSITWTGATEQAEVNGAFRTSSAIQTVDGNVTIRGQDGDGPSYGQLSIANTTWSPA